MRQLEISGRPIGAGSAPYIIAEIGSNHNGDMQLCRELISAAKECGVDAVKFQSWSKSSLISKAEYARNTRYAGPGASTLEQEVEKYQLTRDQHNEVAEYSRETGVVFFSSCFSEAEVDLLDSLGAPAYKIASMDVNHFPLLEYIASKGKPIILSTGLASLGEIERALSVMRNAGAKDIALLHCVSIYPSPPSIVHLRNITTMQTAFDVPVGYSDHTLGVAVPLASVALGASMIEKHFTLDKNMEGWDHRVSADPAEMKALVDGSRAAFEALGSTVRSLDQSQTDKRRVFRRRLVLKRAIPKGSKLSLADVDFKRPGTGINPDELSYVLNRAVSRDLEAEEELEWKDLV